MRLGDEDDDKAMVSGDDEFISSEGRSAIIMVVLAAVFIGWFEYGPDLITREEPKKVADADVSQIAECGKHCVQIIAGAVNLCGGQLSVIESSNMTETVFKSEQGDKFNKIAYYVEARCTNNAVLRADWVSFEVAHEE